MSQLSLTAGSGTGWSTVGTFTTADQDSFPEKFSATINWGDGSTSAGEVTGSDGTFTVKGEHTYEMTGSSSITLTVTNELSEASGSANATATVTAATWTATGGFQQGALAGQTGPYVVGTITDSDPGITASSFSVEIDPGDGSGEDVAGTVTSLGDGEYSVALPYAYARTGAFTATLTVTGPDATEQTATSTVEVGNVYAGVPATLTVATFVATNPSLTATAYTATITWGDGLSSTGIVTLSGGLLTVTGNHTFAVDSIDESSGAYQVSVQVTDTSGDVLTATRPVVVTRPAVTLQVANLVESKTGVVSNQVVATFTEPDASDTPSEFAATINWGDGTTSTGMVTGSNGLFQVVGGHTYATQGNYVIQVEVDQAWGAKLRASVASAKIRRAAPPAASNATTAQIIANSGGAVEPLGRAHAAGPDVTRWFARDLIYQLKHRFEQQSANPAVDFLRFYHQAANLMSYKWLNFGSGRGRGVNTVVLGDLVLGKKQLGNIAFMFIPTIAPLRADVAGLARAWKLNTAAADSPRAIVLGRKVPLASGLDIVALIGYAIEPAYARGAVAPGSVTYRADNLAAFGAGRQLAWAFMEELAPGNPALAQAILRRKLMEPNQAQLNKNIAELAAKLEVVLRRLMNGGNRDLQRAVNSFRRFQPYANPPRITYMALSFTPDYGGYNFNSFSGERFQTLASAMTSIAAASKLWQTYKALEPRGTQTTFEAWRIRLYQQWTSPGNGVGIDARLTP